MTVTEAPPRSQGAAAATRTPRGRPTWLGGLIGIVGVLAVWWLLAVTVFATGGAVPTPWQVVTSMVDDGWDLYWPNVSITAQCALQGFLWGNGLAIIVALVVLLVPPLEGVATQLAIISYCTPLLALGPIILVVFGGRSPEIFLAAISVFFTTVVGALGGLKAADPASIDLVSAYGGNRWQQIRRVRIVAALPLTFAALKIAAPAAVLGAILGEYLGGVDSGIGVALTAAQTSYDVPRTWGIAVAAGLLAGIGYGIVALIARLVVPWTTGAEGSE